MTAPFSTVTLMGHRMVHMKQMLYTSFRIPSSSPAFQPRRSPVLSFPLELEWVEMGEGRSCCPSDASDVACTEYGVRSGDFVGKSLRQARHRRPAVSVGRCESPPYRKRSISQELSRANPSSPHYARATCCDRMARGGVICSTKAHSRAIDSEEGGRASGRVQVESPGGLPVGHGR